MEPTFPFLKLPGEIRNDIYRLLLSPKHVGLKSIACRQAPENHGHTERQKQWYNFQPSILRTNRQTYNEASAIFRSENIFIIIRFQASHLPHAFAPAMTLPTCGQMYQQVAATITLRSTNAEAADHPFVERLYALQDLESTIPYDLMAYQCCTTSPTNIRLHSYPLEKSIDLLNNAAFKAAVHVLYLDKITLILDDNTTREYGPQDLPSMSYPEKLTGAHFLDYLRTMLTISARLTSNPDRVLSHKMFANIVRHLIHILQRVNPLEVHDPHTFWTFIIDGIFALGSLNATPSTMDDRKFQMASMTFDIVVLHTANLQFKHLWQNGLGTRWDIYVAWAFALRESGEGEGPGMAREALKGILADNSDFDSIRGHGLDLTEIKAAVDAVDEVDAEEFRMPGNPCWIAKLTATELETLEFPFEAAREPVD